MVFVIEWTDGQKTLEDVTDTEFHRWANGSGHNQLDLEWSLKHFYYLMNAKLVGWRQTLSCVPKQAQATSEVHELGNEFRSPLLA